MPNNRIESDVRPKKGVSPMKKSTVTLWMLLVLLVCACCREKSRNEDRAESLPQDPGAGNGFRFAGGVPVDKRYFNERFNISFAHPRNWLVLFENESEGTWSKPVCIAEPPKPGGRGGFTLQVSAVHEGGNLDSYMQKAESDLRGIFSGFKLISAQRKETLGWPSAWMTYSYRRNVGTMQELNVTIVFGKVRNVLLQFICEAPASDFNDLLPVFHAIIKSTRISAGDLRLPNTVLTGTERCGRCGSAFGAYEKPVAVMDLELGDVIGLCNRCSVSVDSTKVEGAAAVLGKEGTSDSWEKMVDAFLAKDFSLAVELGKKRTRKHSTDASGHFLLGCAYSRLGRQMECLRHHRIAYKDLGGELPILQWTANLATRRPNSAPALTLWGTALDLVGQKTKAIQTYKKAIATDPKDPEAYLNLANVYKAKKQFSEAETTYQSVLSHVPDCVGAYTALGLLYDENLKQMEKAERAYKKALAIDPSAVNALYNYGNLLLRKRDNASAEALYRRAVEEQSDFAPAYLNLGALHYHAGDTEEALKYFRKAEELDADGQYGKAARANILTLTE